MDKAPYLAENSLSAYERAYDEGYRAVEVDTRSTQDTQPIMMHDDSPSRTTNIDTNEGRYIPLYNAQVRLEDGTQTRPLNTNASPENTELTYSQFESEFTGFKIYDNIGTLVARDPGLTGVPFTLKSLFNFLNGTSDYSVKLRDVTWVLDIQSSQALAAAQQVVGSFNMWNRVVFKLWANGFPYTLTSASPRRPVPALSINKGYFVISINSSNVTTVDTSTDPAKATVKFWDSSAGALGYLQYFVASSNSVSDVGYLFNQLNGVNGAAQLIGIEQFIRGTGGQIDQYLYSSASPIYSYRNPANQLLLSYGVVRYPDLVMQHCDDVPNSNTNCTVFPNGNYSSNTDVLNQVTLNTANIRRSYGMMFNAWILDIAQTTPSAPINLVLTPGAGTITAT